MSPIEKVKTYAFASIVPTFILICLVLIDEKQGFFGGLLIFVYMMYLTHDDLTSPKS